MRVKVILAAVVIIILVMIYLMKRNPPSEVQQIIEDVPVEMSEDANYSGFKSKPQPKQGGLLGTLQGLFRPAKPTVVVPSRPAVVSPSRPVQPIQAPKVYRVSPPPNISTLPGKPGSKVLNMQCPNQQGGNFIKEIRVSDGKYIDAIQATCADGTVMKQGGLGGWAQEPRKTNVGFHEITTRYGDWIDQMQIYSFEDKGATPVYGKKYMLGGGFQGDIGRRGDRITCPKYGDRISGLVGTYGDYINQLEVGCVSQNPV